MGGRITAISVFEADPTTYWVATASGGLLKTINNGITFEHQFDHEATVSIGDVCVAPSDRNIVWVGTGENNPRNSVSYGDGVYKSTDGGKTWKNMGLKKSFQIGKIVVHPKNPNIVYVGALGRLYGPNEERGLFKTTDGGKTWEKVLFVDDKTGVIDMQMNPADPETLLVATWERQRDGSTAIAANRRWQDGYDAYDPDQEMGPGRRHLQDHRRRQDLQQAHQGPADRAAGPHRPRLLPQGSEGRLRHHRLRRRSAWAPPPSQVLPRHPGRGRRRPAARSSTQVSDGQPGGQGRPASRATSSRPSTKKRSRRTSSWSSRSRRTRPATS